MDLSGRWRATVADDDLLRRFHLPDCADDDWVELDVPGHWRSTPELVDEAGPLLYRRRFRTDDRPPADDGIDPDRARWWLHLDGVFCQGDVWLDGTYLGDTEGYFVPHTFEVTDTLGSGAEHLLAVEVACPAITDPTAKRQLTGSFQDPDVVDPAWSPGGIWRPVRLARSGPVAVLHFRAVCLSADPSGARLALRAVLDASEATDAVLTTTVAGVEHEHPCQLAAGENRFEWRVDVPEPDLWWPWSLGDQPLHDLTTRVTVDSVVSDERRVRLGFRSIRLHNWVASVNGERLHLKGASVPPSVRALGDADPATVGRPADTARELGLDFVRLHTHLSRPEFYERCDELGLLVWQDLPLGGGYARSVRAEAMRQAREAVDLLAHHPSVFLWCGHDDPAGTDRTERRPIARSRPQQRPSWNRDVLDRSVRRVVHRCDPSRPVIPHSGVRPHLPSLDGTDTHAWFGWLDGTVADLAEHLRTHPREARFVSAFGAQAPPVPPTDLLDPERWPDLDWGRLSAHHGLDAATMLARFPPHRSPDPEHWAHLVQTHQAEVVERTIEVLRRLKYHPNGGFSVHTLTEAQPQIGFSAFDHAGRAKPAAEAIARACRPVIVVADPFPTALVAGDEVDQAVHVVSDLRHELTRCTVTVDLRHPEGDAQWRFTGDIGPDTCERVGVIRWRVPVAWGPITLELSLETPDLAVTNTYRTGLPSSVG